MAFWQLAMGTTENPDQPIASGDCVHRGTRLVWPTSAVHLTSCHARDPQLRTFSAPDRPVTVPNCGGGAPEDLTGWHDLRGRGWQEVPANDRHGEAKEEASWTHWPKMFPVQRLMCVLPSKTVT